jgi:aerobic-type carbon monoxide dehydrogenase small subunit (CoxS/CutS family)
VTLSAFVKARAFQCSYCIPPMALTVAALLDTDPSASAETIREQLAGNICRCGSYPQIVEATGTGDKTALRDHATRRTGAEFAIRRRRLRTARRLF